MIGYIAVCDKCGQHPIVEISSFKDGAVSAALYAGWKVNDVPQTGDTKVECPKCMKRKNKGR